MGKHIKKKTLCSDNALKKIKLNNVIEAGTFFKTEVGDLLVLSLILQCQEGRRMSTSGGRVFQERKISKIQSSWSFLGLTETL